MSGDNTIVIKEIEGYGDAAALRGAVREMFSHSSFSHGISGEKTMLVKVNALMRARPDEAVTTHPAVVSAVIAELKALGARDILIADSPSGPFTGSRLAGIYEAAGFAALEGDGVRLWRSGDSVKLPVKGAGELDILKCIFDADIKIGVGKLKTHALMGMTGAVKLWFGAIPGLKKAEAHCLFPGRAEFAAMLCALYDALKVDFSVVDAIEGMQGNGPSGGEKRAFGFIAGGADAHSLDRALCHMLGVAPENAPTAARSIALGLAPADARELAAEGDLALMLKPISDLKLPDSFAAPENGSEGAIERFARLLAAPRPAVRASDCVGCGRCAEICPQHTIEIKAGKAKIHSKNCIRCFCCHEVCPQRAIDIKSRWFFRVFK